MSAVDRSPAPPDHEPTIEVAGPRRNTVVAYDGRAAADVALEVATSHVATAGGRLTVAVVAETERPARCCNLQTVSWNREIREFAARDIVKARARVDPRIDTDFRIVETQGDRVGTLAGLARAVAADLVVVPRDGGRIRHLAGRDLATRLRRAGVAGVVEPR